MSEKPSNPEALSEGLNKKIQALDSWIQNNLKNGRFRYSRVQIPENYPWEQNEDGSVTVNAAPFNKLGQDAVERFNGGEDIVGTCREIAPSAAKILEAEGLLTNTRVLACTNDGEMHYCVAGDVKDDDTDESASVVVDLGYSQPVPVAVPVSTGAKISDFYNSEKGPGQIYNGEVSYEAVNAGKGVTLTIRSAADNVQVKKFEFQPAELVDEKIVSGFASVTGSLAETRIDSAEGNKVVRENHDTSNRFHELHQLIRETGAEVRVVFGK